MRSVIEFAQVSSKIVLICLKAQPSNSFAIQVLLQQVTMIMVKLKFSTMN